MITEKDFRDEIQSHFQNKIKEDVAADCYELARQMATGFANWIGSIECGHISTYTGSGMWYKQENFKDTELRTTEQLFELYIKSNR